jgi:hypothetical protein
VHEPDNDEWDAFSRFGTRNLGGYPYLMPGERAASYELLWDMAFAGGWPVGRAGRIAARMVGRLPSPLAHATLPVMQRWASKGAGPFEVVLVKTVRSHLSVEWIAHRYQPVTVVVFRKPLNMLPGWLKLGWGSYFLDMQELVREALEPLGLWPSPTDRVANAMWSLCALEHMLRLAVARHPEWLVVRHEDLCADSLGGMRTVAEQIGISWSEAATTFLRDSDQPGTGWELKRVAHEEVDGWRRRLSPAELETAFAVLGQFATIGEARKDLRA